MYQVFLKFDSKESTPVSTEPCADASPVELGLYRHRKPQLSEWTETVKFLLTSNTTNKDANLL